MDISDFLYALSISGKFKYIADVILKISLNQFIQIHDINNLLKLLTQISLDKSNGTTDNKNIHDKLQKLIKNRINSIFTKYDLIPNMPAKRSGGYSWDVWPVISELFKKNLFNLTFNKILPDGSQDINFIRVINKSIGKPKEPILAHGSFTAVYIINIKGDPSEFVLRITKPKNPGSLYFDTDKSKLEFLNFREYMIDVIGYGNINFEYNYILADPYKYEAKRYNVYPNQQNYNFEYTITKKYNNFKDSYIPGTNKYLGFGISNKQKFDLLINTIKMLEVFREKNKIIPDFKIDNIGIDELRNPILIDYDDESIIDLNDPIYFGPYASKGLTRTFTPNYISAYSHDYKKYDKYSVGALVYYIIYLEIEYKDTELKLPIFLQHNSIEIIKLNEMFDYFGLSDRNYNNIATYKKMIDVLEYIKTQDVLLD